MKNIDEKIKAANSYTDALRSLGIAQENLAEAETKFDADFFRSRIRHFESECAIKWNSLVELHIGNARPISPAGSFEAVKQIAENHLNS